MTNAHAGHVQIEALGDATRRAILEQLLAGPMPVGELAKRFPVSRPAISQHLAVLKRAHLVADRAEGNRRVYHVNLQGIEAMRAYLDRFWHDALASFKRAAEESHR